VKVIKTLGAFCWVRAIKYEIITLLCILSEFLERRAEQNRTGWVIGQYAALLFSALWGGGQFLIKIVLCKMLLFKQDLIAKLLTVMAVKCGSIN